MYENTVQYAIRFGEGIDKGLEKQKAFPFIYSLIPTENDLWEQNKATDNLTGFGPLVPANSTILHPVRTRQDYPFLLLWIKFSVLYYDDQSSSYLWYEPVTSPANWFLEQFDHNAAIGTPLVNSIDVSLWFDGPDGRYLYGGQALNQTDGGIVNGKIPLPLESAQGYDFGYAQLRTPYFLPTEASLMFEITNRHTIKDLRVAALIYGLKVRV